MTWVSIGNAELHLRIEFVSKKKKCNVFITKGKFNQLLWALYEWKGDGPHGAKEKVAPGQEYLVLFHCPPVEKARAWKDEIPGYGLFYSVLGGVGSPRLICTTQIALKVTHCSGSLFALALKQPSESQINYLGIYRSKRASRPLVLWHVWENSLIAEKRKGISRSGMVSTIPEFWRVATWTLFSSKTRIFSALFADFAKHLGKCQQIVGSINICWIN